MRLLLIASVLVGCGVSGDRGEPGNTGATGPQGVPGTTGAPGAAADHRTVYVTGNDDPSIAGKALRDALGSLTEIGATNWTVIVEHGNYELGDATLIVPTFVNVMTLPGFSSFWTTNASPGVLLEDGSELRNIVLKCSDATNTCVQQRGAAASLFDGSVSAKNTALTIDGGAMLTGVAMTSSATGATTVVCNGDFATLDDVVVRGDRPFVASESCGVSANDSLLFGGINSFEMGRSASFVDSNTYAAIVLPSGGELRAVRSSINSITIPTGSASLEMDSSTLWEPSQGPSGTQLSGYIRYSVIGAGVVTGGLTLDSFACSYNVDLQSAPTSCN